MSSSSHVCQSALPVVAVAVGRCGGWRPGRCMVYGVLRCGCGGPGLPCRAALTLHFVICHHCLQVTAVLGRPRPCTRPHTHTAAAAFVVLGGASNGRGQQGACRHGAVGRGALLPRTGRMRLPSARPCVRAVCSCFVSVPASVAAWPKRRCRTRGGVGVEAGMDGGIAVMCIVPYVLYVVGVQEC